MSVTLKILIIDDEMGMRSGIERALRKYETQLPYLKETINFSLSTASSGEEGLLAMAAELPDILLLDHKLPEMTGIDVLEAMNEKDIKVLTIMITAFASLKTAISAIKLGAYDFVAKPFTPSELKASIHKATKHLIALRQAEKLEEEKRKVRFQFMSVLTHELKAPLAAVENFLSILEDPENLKDQETYQHIIGRSMARIQGMRKLILDMLDLTRIESGTSERDFEPVNLTELAKTSIETAALEAKNRNIQITMKTGEPVTLLAEHGEMEIILNNLITNSVKYNKDGGSVSVEINPTENGAVIEVKDTGIGMSKQECEKLFHDFVRIKNAKTRNITGSGLGLSTVKKLSQLYDGDIIVDSEENKGSTFTVTLQNGRKSKNHKE